MPPKRKAAGDDADPDRTRKDAIRQQVTERIRDLDPSAATAYLEVLANKWQLEFPGLSYEQIIALAFSNFGLNVADDSLDISDTGSFGLRALDDIIDEHEMEAIGVYHRLRELKLLENNSELLSKIISVIEAVYYARKIVISAFQAKLSLFSSSAEGVALDPTLDERLGSWSLRFRWVDMDQTNQLQRLLIHLLDVAMEKRYRKQGGMVFEPIYVDSRNTHAWKQVMDVKSFIYANSSKELHFDQWLNLTNGNSNTKTAVEYLTNCNDYQFPHLVKDRTVFAFRNGLYMAREDAFKAFEDVPDSVVACKFFDADFDEHLASAPWQDIPTPNFESIMKHQDFPADVCRWMAILIGRLIFPLNEFDGWQVIPFFNGLAGCFARGTNILMADGTTKHAENVVVGDALVGDDGSTRRVTSLGRGRQAMYRIISVEDGESYVVNEDHVLCLQYTDHAQIQAVLGDGAYEIRMYTGDGTFDRRFFSTMDAARNALANEKNAAGPVVVEISVKEYLAVASWIKEGLRGYRVAIDRFPGIPFFPQPVDAVYSYGRQVPTMTTSRMPIEYRYGSRATRLAVMWGIFDATGGHLHIPSNARLVDDVVFVARSLGFDVVQPDPHTCITRENIDSPENRITKKIVTNSIVVEPVGIDDYFGFSVDGNNRFLLGDFTATHNSGKSTIVLRVCKALYEAIDVGVLSNNVERKFGISAFYDKLIFVAPEIKSDLAIEQAEFQSIVSGEDVQVNVKFCKAFGTTWRVPGVLAGNQVPAWADNSGSIQRRIVVFEFTKPVLQGDMKLGDKLEAEMPNILVKCCRAYRQAAAAHGMQNIWSILPVYFQQTRDELAANVNSLEAFLASGEVVLGRDKYCPLADLKNALRAFEITNGYKSGKMTAEFWRGPFARHNLEKRMDSLEYRGKKLKREYIFGVDLADSECTMMTNALG
jgi:hypothetical protein